jgi:hypothetical protein
LTQYASGCGRRSKCEQVMRLAVYDTNALIQSPPPTVTTPTFTLEKGDLGITRYTGFGLAAVESAAAWASVVALTSDVRSCGVCFVGGFCWL